MNDPISDFLTRIRNAQKQTHRFIDVPLSKQKLHIAKVLQKQGFIENVLVNDEKKKMRIFLKYSTDRMSILSGLRRISSPGLRKYVSYKKIPKIFGGLGIAVLSTPKGIIDGETARELKVGGELLCYIW
ncbi:MAG: 30S ribosomal protein S8 [Chlamydiae bacterium]|nr:30S ribosomal protein S8 [Chlamydiota bacterium]